MRVGPHPESRSIRVRPDPRPGWPTRSGTRPFPTETSMLLAQHHRWILIGSIVVAAACSLVGCTMVADKLTGLSLERVNPSECLKECATSQSDLVRAEATYHQSQIRACQAVPESEREACHEAEAARHAEAMAGIAAGRRDFMNNCHRQGNGSAG